MRFLISFCVVVMVFLPGFMPAVAQDRVEIPYKSDLIECSNRFVFGMTGEYWQIQDLTAGKLIVAAKSKPAVPEIVSLPEQVLSLCITGKEVYALTRSGVAVFNDLPATIEFLKNAYMAGAAVVALPKAMLEGRRSDYRLFIDPKGNLALWKKLQNRLVIFDRHGSPICDYPCPSRPLFTDRDSFLSVFYSPKSGSKIMEIAYRRAIEDQRQVENDTLFVDVRGNRRFGLATYNASETFFTGILRPEGDRNRVEPVLYVKVAANSAIEELAALPADFCQEEIWPGSGTFSYLQPEYAAISETATIPASLEKLVLYLQPVKNR